MPHEKGHKATGEWYGTLENKQNLYHYEDKDEAGVNIFNENPDSKFAIKIKHIASGAKVRFPAFLKEWSDRYTSEWNQEMVFGRMDPIEIFQGTKREISLGWDVVAGSRSEAKKNLRNVSLLINMLYPTYKVHGSTKTSGYKGLHASISAAPLLLMKFTNLVASAQKGGPGSGLVGRMSGLSVVPQLEAGFINSGDSEEDLSSRLYPKVITLSCTFYVLHTHMMGWSANEKKTAFNPSFPYGLRYGSGVKRASISHKGESSPDVDSGTDSTEDAVDAAAATPVTSPTK